MEPARGHEIPPSAMAPVSDRWASIAERRQAAILSETKARLRELTEGQARDCASMYDGASRHDFDGLSHRSLLLDWLNRALIEQNLQPEALTRLLFDLDRFDGENRTLGHAAGDRLLQLVAERLLACPVSVPATGAMSAGAFIERHTAQGSPRSVTSRLTDCSLFAGLEPETTPHVARLINPRIRSLKGEVLYRIGGRFRALFAIHAGSCKSVLLTRGGHQQVAGYHMAGEIVGMDGIATGAHECQVIALEDMELCPLAFDEIERLAQLSRLFRHNLHKLLSRECVRAQHRMLVLGTMPAEQRLALFLVDLSRRHGARGYSSFEFVLRMTRDEIGSYLGIALETVSRLFSRFQREGLIQVQGRTVKLLDGVAMNRLVDGG